MSEEINKSQETEDPSAVVESITTDEVINWEQKYQEEVQSSKGYRQRAQNAEGKLDKQDKESEKARKKKMEEDGKLKELIAEQDKVIEILKVKADAGEQLLKDQHTRLLEELPENDREDFADLPINQLSKVVAKLKAAESIKSEIPSVKGAVKGAEKPLKNFWAMNKEEQDANWNDTVDGYIKRSKLNKS